MIVGNSTKGEITAWKPPRSELDPLWPEPGPIDLDPDPPPGTASNAPGSSQGRFEPSEEDRAWAAEASEQGRFLPEIKTPGAGGKKKHFRGGNPEK
jgi:hypothetical protein